jgi:hypothetical protein
MLKNENILYKSFIRIFHTWHVQKDPVNEHEQMNGPDAILVCFRWIVQTFLKEFQPTF